MKILRSGASSSDVAWIASAVARDTTVCAYDRAGRGWSEATDGPQDGNHIAADLHTLLEAALISRVTDAVVARRGIDEGQR